MLATVRAWGPERGFAGKKCRDPYLYEASELPHWYAPEKRFTRRGHMVFLGQ